VPTETQDSHDVDHPELDASWDDEARDETPTQRLDRNRADLLQELRVVQTGVQLLTGFLLTLPFQARFSALTRFEQDAYLVTVGCSVAATGLLIAPVNRHRLLFRRHARLVLVSVAHRLALCGLLFLGCAVVGVVLLIVHFLRGAAAGWVGASGTALLLVCLWFLLPTAIRGRSRRR